MIIVLLPAYNEASNLPAVLAKIKDEMRIAGLDYRVVVVNDGSVDETAAVSQAHAAHMPLDVVHHRVNRGLWETVRDGFEWAAENAGPGDIVVRMDADDTHEPRYIPAMVAKVMEGFDVVVASRFQPGGGQEGVGAYRACLSRCANLLMKVCFPIRGLWEYTCGFRAYRAEVVQAALRIYGNAFIDVRGLGFTCTLEKIIRLRSLEARFAEVPFVLRYDQKRGSSKMPTGLTVFGYLVLIVKYVYPWGDAAKRRHREAKAWGRSRRTAPAAADPAAPSIHRAASPGEPSALEQARAPESG